ncbi:hypothetical protein F4604DRAFT_1920737 [Suillus subluteus]|nr:hypothetical protein F4604DRAFT_1920737 [Suillus subluteus]
MDVNTVKGAVYETWMEDVTHWDIRDILAESDIPEEEVHTAMWEFIKTLWVEHLNFKASGGISLPHYNIFAASPMSIPTGAAWPSISSPACYATQSLTPAVEARTSTGAYLAYSLSHYRHPHIARRHAPYRCTALRALAAARARTLDPIACPLHVLSMSSLAEVLVLDLPHYTLEESILSSNPLGTTCIHLSFLALTAAYAPSQTYYSGMGQNTTTQGPPPATREEEDAEEGTSPDK